MDARQPLDCAQDEDAYYLGMRNLSGIVEIARENWDSELGFAFGFHALSGTPYGTAAP